VPQPKGIRLLDVLAAVIDTLRRAKVPCMMIGAWVLGVWGRPRATMDLDFLVMLEEGAFGCFGKQLIQEGFSLDESWQEWKPMLKGLQLRMQLHGVTVDLMRPRDFHDRQAFARRKRKRLAGRYCWLVAPEDFILQKMKVGRPRDVEDTLSVIERSRQILDLDYLQDWAARLGLRDELNYLMGD
jgi:hypothetical protein